MRRHHQEDQQHRRNCAVYNRRDKQRLNLGYRAEDNTYASRSGEQDHAVELRGSLERLVEPFWPVEQLRTRVGNGAGPDRDSGSPHLGKSGRVQGSGRRQHHEVETNMRHEHPEGNICVGRTHQQPRLGSQQAHGILPGTCWLLGFLRRLPEE